MTRRPAKGRRASSFVLTVRRPDASLSLVVLEAVDVPRARRLATLELRRHPAGSAATLALYGRVVGTRASASAPWRKPLP